MLQLVILLHHHSYVNLHFVHSFLTQGKNLVLFVCLRVLFYPNIFLNFRFQYVQAVEGMEKSYLNIVVNAMGKDEYGLRKVSKLKFLLV